MQLFAAGAKFILSKQHTV